MPDYRIARTTITGYGHCRFCGLQITGEVRMIEEVRDGKWEPRDIPFCSESCAREALAPLNEDRRRAFEGLDRLPKLVGELSRLAGYAGMAGAREEARDLARAADLVRMASETIRLMPGPVPVSIEVLETAP